MRHLTLHYLFISLLLLTIVQYMQPIVASNGPSSIVSDQESRQNHSKIPEAEEDNDDKKTDCIDEEDMPGKIPMVSPDFTNTRRVYESDNLTIDVYPSDLQVSFKNSSDDFLARPRAELEQLEAEQAKNGVVVESDLDSDEDDSDVGSDELANLRNEIDKAYKLEKLHEELKKADQVDYVVEESAIDPAKELHKYVISQPSYRKNELQSSDVVVSADRKKRDLPKDMPLGSLQGETFVQTVDDNSAKAFWTELHHGAQEEGLEAHLRSESLKDVLEEEANKTSAEDSDATVDDETAKIFWNTVAKKAEQENPPKVVSLLTDQASLLDSDESSEEDSNEDGFKKPTSEKGENLKNLLKQAFDKKAANFETPKNLEILNKILGNDSDVEISGEVEIIEIEPIYLNAIQPSKFGSFEPKSISDFPSPDAFLAGEEERPKPILAIDPPAKPMDIAQRPTQVKPWLSEPFPRPVFPSFPTPETFLQGNSTAPKPIIAIEPPMKEMPHVIQPISRPGLIPSSKIDRVSAKPSILKVFEYPEDEEDYSEEDSYEDSDESLGDGVIVEETIEVTYYDDDQDSKKLPDNNIFIKDSVANFNDGVEERPKADSPVLEILKQKLDEANKIENAQTIHEIPILPPMIEPIVPNNMPEYKHSMDINEVMHRHEDLILDDEEWNNNSFSITITLTPMVVLILGFCVALCLLWKVFLIVHHTKTVENHKITPVYAATKDVKIPPV